MMPGCRQTRFLLDTGLDGVADFELPFVQDSKMRKDIGLDLLAVAHLELNRRAA